MSSLIFHTDEELALVATDTLAGSVDGNVPFKFTTKAFPVPHLKMIVASTGIGGFGLSWFIQICDNVVVEDVEHLNYHAPGVLLKLWRQFEQLNAIKNNLTATVYHFGFAQSTGHIKSYAYRSTNDFASEQLKYGLGVKPPLPNQEEYYQFPLNVKKIMDAQRAIEHAKPQKDRLLIGGEIHVLVLDKNGFTISTEDRFDDYGRAREDPSTTRPDQEPREYLPQRERVAWLVVT